MTQAPCNTGNTGSAGSAGNVDTCIYMNAHRCHSLPRSLCVLCVHPPSNSSCGRCPLTVHRLGVGYSLLRILVYSAIFSCAYTFCKKKVLAPPFPPYLTPPEYHQPFHKGYLYLWLENDMEFRIYLLHLFHLFLCLEIFA